MDQIQQTADNDLQTAIDNINNNPNPSTDAGTDFAPPPAPQDFNTNLGDNGTLPMPPDLTPPTGQSAPGPDPIQPAGFSVPVTSSNTTFDSTDSTDENFGANDAYNPTDTQPGQNSEFNIPTPSFDSPSSDGDNYGPDNNFGADTPLDYHTDNTQHNNGDSHQGNSHMNNYQDQDQNQNPNQFNNDYNSPNPSNNYDQNNSNDNFSQGSPSDNFNQNNRSDDSYSSYNRDNRPGSDYDQGNRPEPSAAPSPDRSQHHNSPEQNGTQARLTGDDAHKIKEAAMRSIIPLLNSPSDTLDPEEKFNLCQDILETTNDQTVLAPTYDAASAIQDDKKRFDALHELINMID